jgi:hypothetical protein
MDPNPHPDGPLHADHAAVLRLTALALTVGGILMALFEVARIFAGDGAAYARVAGIVAGIGQLGIAAGCVGLWLHHSFGGSVLARTGLALAIVGFVLYATGSVAEPFEPGLWWPFAAATLLIPLGFILAGVAALRAHVWDGWARYLPLAVGVYPVVALYPWLFTVGPDGVAPWVGGVLTAGWGVLLALLGWVEYEHVEHRTRAFARLGRTRNRD